VGVRLITGLLVLLSCFSPLRAAEPWVLHSGVSGSYKNGLQQQYLQYLAKGINAHLQVTYASFPRRLHMLKIGAIDLMVGLSYTPERAEHIYYIRPHYFDNPLALFMVNPNRGNAPSEATIGHYQIGTIRNAKYFDAIDNSPNRVAVGTVEQLIKMLLAGRLDGFIYNRRGGIAKLQQMQLLSKVTVLELSEAANNALYIGISKRSKLYTDPQRLRQLVQLQQHYPQLRQDFYAVKP